MRQFDFGTHLPVDEFRRFVISGRADPVPEWTTETGRQFDLARQSMAQTAANYAAAGFAVAIDDVILPDEVAKLKADYLSEYQVYSVLLRPSLEITLRRNADRTHKSFDTSILNQVIENLYHSMEQSDYEQAGWLVLATDELSIDQTVSQILAWSGVK